MGTLRHSNVLYFISLYCTVLYCIVLYSNVLYSAVLYCGPDPALICHSLTLWALNCSGCFYSVLYCTVLYCTVLYCTVLYCTVLYCALLYFTELFGMFPFYFDNLFGDLFRKYIF